MAAKTPILITGTTGYIGGTVLARLLNHPSASTFDITATVRNADKAKILREKFGVNAVVANHEELEKFEHLAENSHVIFHIADADDEPLAKAILSGLRKRHAKLGDLPILIHTSGTGVLTDDARGEYATETIYNDLDVKQIKSIPPTALHRNVDLLVVGADEEGYARTHIILPSTIYGIAKHALVDAGISNAHSIQIPKLILASLDRKRAGVVGPGNSMWPSVHIDEIADLYITLFDSIVSKPEQTGHGWEGFYFGESGEHRWIQISKAIGDALLALGISDNAEPAAFTREELVKYAGSEAAGWYSGSNSRCRGNRGRSIGWKTTHSTEDMLASVRLEVEALVKKQ